MKRNKLLAMALSLALVFPFANTNTKSHAVIETIKTDDGFIFNKLSYTYWGTEYLELIAYEGTDPDVVIPESIDGITISQINKGAFKNNKIIKNVTLPDSIGLQSEVFYNSSIVSVNIPKTVQVIPNYTFNSCQNLQTVYWHDDIKIIPKDAFESSSYTLPTDLLSKCTYATAPYSGLNNTIITDIVTYKDGQTIDFDYRLDYNNYAILKEIRGLGNQLDIEIPEEVMGFPVRENEDNGLNKSRIRSIKFPSTMSSIDFKPNYPEMLESVTFLRDEIYLKVNFAGTSVTELELPRIRNMDNFTLKNASCLKKVEFVKGEDKLKIKDRFFENCFSLEEVIFPGSYTELTLKKAFHNTNLKRLELNGKTTIDGDTFKDCPNLQELKINYNIKAPDRTFEPCHLENIIIDDITRTGKFMYLSGSQYLTKINSTEIFDNETGDFIPKYKDFVVKNFANCDDIGFINQYVMYQVKNIVKDYTNDKMSDMEKAKILHDWLCDNVVYDDGSADYSSTHNDLSSFFSGVTVCDGYARGLNLLLNEAGIETYLVTSDNHKWNIAKIGGHYFHIDTTWDDGENPVYDWFMKSDSQMKAETTSHSSWQLQKPSSLHNFQGDTLPECQYAMGDTNKDGRISVADMVKMSSYILNTKPADKNDIVFYDVDFSGNVDVFDIIKMRKLITENPANENLQQLSQWLTGETDSIDSSYDINKDDVIDVFDYILLKQQIL